MQLRNKTIFIQIPCLNEAWTIERVLKDIPKEELENLGLIVKILVIDDGSKDKTYEKAKSSGADFVLRHKKTLGLARSFKDGIKFSLKNRADIIVNTDGDNQYDQKEIVRLIKPLLQKRADMVIGDRQIDKLKFMPKGKKIGNKIGNLSLQLLTNLKINDASSGFRAFNRDIAEKFNLYSAYTYTHETIIQAVSLHAKVVFVPVTFRKRVSGDSRLIGSVFDHIKKSSFTIVRAVLTS